MVLILNCCFRQKYMSSIHNTYFSVNFLFISSKSGEKSAILQAKTVLNKYDSGFWCERLFHWTKHYYGLWLIVLARRDDLKILMIDLFLPNMQFFSLHKMLIDGLESFGLLVDYCDVFTSCLDSHSDGTHSLQRILWWASDVMLHFSNFVPIKQTNLHLGWPEGV